ncbi:MAG: hypothetical protein WD066_15420 [Planctomycetaceae bacterium]
MRWPDSLAEGFPAPRDDEPESLRQDIADELADHLDCALRKELHATPDKEQAHRKVLERFGDPQTIARRLWFDALKEKIMSQRIMLALAVVMTCACLAAAGLVWSAIDSGQTAIAALVEQSRAANEAARQASEAGRAANEALLARIEELGASPAAPPSLEWNPVKIKLATADKRTPIPPGFRVTLTGNVLDTAKDTTITGKLADDGTADFGLVRTGQHTLRVVTPFDQDFSDSITVQPGKPFLREIIVPGELPGEAEVTVTADWPADLRDKGLWLIFQVVPMSPLATDTERYTRSGRGTRRTGWSIRAPAARAHLVAVAPDGGLLDFEPNELGAGLDLYGIFDASRGRSAVRPDQETRGLVRPANFKSLFSPEEGSSEVDRFAFILPSGEASASVRWSAVPYQLQEMVVATDPAELNEAADKLRVLSGSLSHANLGNAGSGGRSGVFNRAMGIDPEHSRFIPIVDSPRFDPVAGQPNHWKITLPEGLLTIIREQFALRSEARIRVEAEKAAMGTLQGVWIGASQTNDGDSEAPSYNYAYVFRDDRVARTRATRDLDAGTVAAVAGALEQGGGSRYFVDTGQSPAQLTLYHDSRVQIAAIYELRDDELKIAWCPQDAGTRPSSFQHEGSGDDKRRLEVLTMRKQK